MSMISFRRRAARLKSEARKREKESHDIKEEGSKPAPKKSVVPAPPPPVPEPAPVREEVKFEENKAKVRKDG